MGRQRFPPVALPARVSRIAPARGTALIGIVLHSQAIPRTVASSPVNPTTATCGSVKDEARLLLENILTYSNHVGLYAEEIGPTGEALGGVTHVFIRNFAYQPANIEVVWGMIVTWTNSDNAVHSVVLPHIIDSENDIRESGPPGQGQSFKYTFLAQGTFQYYCVEHPYMIGIVTVT